MLGPIGMTRADIPTPSVEAGAAMQGDDCRKRPGAAGAEKLPMDCQALARERDRLGAGRGGGECERQETNWKILCRNARHRVFFPGYAQRGLRASALRG